MDKNLIIENIVKYVKTNNEIKNICEKEKLTKEQIVDSLSTLTTFIECKDACDRCLKNGKCISLSQYKSPQIRYTNKFIVSFEKCMFAKTEIEDDCGDINPLVDDIDINCTKERTKVLLMLNEFKEKYLKKEKAKGIYLWGNCGVGKSAILKKFALTLIKAKVDVYYRGYPDLTRDVMTLMGSEDFSSLVSRLKTCEVLILDDVGREANNPYVRDEILGPVLQYRMDNYLPVFMTSNHNYPNLVNHLAYTNQGSDQIKANGLIERIKCLMNECELSGKNYRE